MKIQPSNMKNPLKSDSFNRYEATKDRSPLFRAFVVLLLLIVGCILLYTLSQTKSNKEETGEMATKPSLNVSK